LLDQGSVQHDGADGDLAFFSTWCPIGTSTPTVNRATDVHQARVVVKYGYWRGHRGYRYRRPGYRFYNGFWYSGIAFGPTVVIRPGRGGMVWPAMEQASLLALTIQKARCPAGFLLSKRYSHL
jgi:hypothetical protein